MKLRQLAFDALLLPVPDDKCAAVRAITLTGELDLATPDTRRLAMATLPGRGARPALVTPAKLAKRPVTSPEGRAALIHSLAHIELNAVNLALDIVWRFDGMPADFYRDWIGVAGDEASHFGLLREHLRTLAFDYGDFPAHDGLWAMAERTSDDLLARLALVPRTLEARGLDAAPPIRDKLQGVGDKAGAAILAIILADEIGHVAIGNRWYRWLCAQRGLDPVVCYAELAQRHRAPRLRGPFNLDARRAAGFDEQELAALQAP
ncbi:MAG: ferritin-like domain-containing protein [Candidatus Accumulibacter sp.]|nr:ferritin-like domain-containing protein [Accumulibacter sp.]